MRTAAAAVALVSAALVAAACERAGWGWPMERLEEWLFGPRRPAADEHRLNQFWR